MQVFFDTSLAVHEIWPSIFWQHKFNCRLLAGSFIVRGYLYLFKLNAFLAP